MIYLCCAILCSVMISIIMRISSKYVKGNISMLVVNYATCFLISLIMNQNYHSFDSSIFSTIGYGLIHGCLYLVSFVLFQTSVQKNGMILSSMYMKLGLLVPFILSIFLFHEIPSMIQFIGFILAIIAIFIMNHPQKKINQHTILLLFLLLGSGFADAMSKIFEEWGISSQQALFLIITFLSAFLFAFVLSIVKKETLSYYELLFGIFIGIPNYYSAYFLLQSLHSVPAILAYPIYSSSTILLVTMIGVYCFKERLSLLSKISMILILIALILLNL